MDSIHIPKLALESDGEYIKRICSMKKENNWTWNTVRDIINEALGCNYSESHYRKNYAVDSVIDDDNDSKETKTLKKIQQERIKLSDERSENRALFRRITREQTLVELAHVAAANLSSKFQLEVPIVCAQSSHKAILQLSDWHYGLIIDNAWNKFDLNIAKKRIAQLATSVIHKCKSNDVSELYIVNLGDLISGRIHETIRIQNRIDVITQCFEVSDLLAEFIVKIRESNISVKYISCADNHSRLEPKKESSLDLESLTRVIDKILSLTVGKLDGVTILESPYGHDIATFKIFNHSVVGVHGHKDSPKNIVPNMSLMTKQHYDLALTAHLHHFSADEMNETLIVSNGSLMGTDDYAQQLRLSSYPSQTLIICSPEDVAESIHRIVLD